LIIVMSHTATDENIEAVREKLREFGYETQLSSSGHSTIICLTGEYTDFKVKDVIRSMKGVYGTVPLVKPFHLISRDYQQEDTIIRAGGVSIGGKEVIVMAGPSAVDRRDQVLLTALAIREAGARVLRGGAYKPRVHFDVNPSLGREGLELLKEARQESGLLVITEVRNPGEVEIVAEYADIIQISATYMQYYELLAAAADRRKPVLLKRGMMSSIEEWLTAAEFIVQRGNPNVILCERGIRTFEKYTSYTLDLCAIPVVKRISHLPVIVDPSHATGFAEYVPAMAKAAIAAGADGLLIEVHPSPDEAVLYGIRQMTLQQFKDLMVELKSIARSVGRMI
jgi:3-deoxy-7-phosphoheptulonate synthase